MMDMYSVVSALKHDSKRMTKLNACSNSIVARQKATNYVVAMCRELKVKLSENEIIKASVMVLGY